MGGNYSTTLPELHPSSFHGKKKGLLAEKKHRVTCFYSSTNWRIHFDASKQTNTLMVITFTAKRSGAAKYMEPVVYEFAAQYSSDVDFIKIDVDQLPDVAQDFGVESVPMFVFVKKGKVIDKVVGADREELQKKIQKHRS